jgi:hypothetical protein
MAPVLDQMHFTASEVQDLDERVWTQVIDPAILVHDGRLPAFQSHIMLGIAIVDQLRSTTHRRRITVQCDEHANGKQDI